jgi:CRISPR/Cas system CMR-associated protein Cmr5 small subunit
MKIEKSIKVERYPYTDPKSNQIIIPPPIELSELNISFEENNQQKTVFAKIDNFPVKVLLFGPRSYNSLSELKNKEKAFEDKLLSLLGENPSIFLQSLLPKTLEADPNGPGSILSGMLSSLGIKSAPTCSCKRRALEMNTRGPDWCEQNVDHIVGWLEEEAKKRRLPFIKTVAKLMVQRAISKSRRLLAKANAKT